MFYLSNSARASAVLCYPIGKNVGATIISPQSLMWAAKKLHRRFLAVKLHQECGSKAYDSTDLNCYWYAHDDFATPDHALS